MNCKRLAGMALAAIIATGIKACSGEPLSTREKGTLIGGAAGAGAGALIGSAVGHPGAGAAIGGVGGAAAGYGVGNHMQNQQYDEYYRQRDY
jgi:osmotically inducible lipoprotein OsmB